MVTNEKKIHRCAIYTRKSSEQGLEQDFNSLDAQRESAEAYIKSQAHEGWRLAKKAHFDDGGHSGGTLERPALQSLIAEIRARRIDVVVVYKVDRLTRSLADFAKLVELFEAQGVSFVAVTQQFNTTTSMGRLTLNVLLSFAQFERELASERIRDKFAASRQKGMWMGGTVPLGYDVKDRKLVINPEEADRVRLIFQRYLALGRVSELRRELAQRQIRSKQRVLTSGKVIGGFSFRTGHLYFLLHNRTYLGEVVHKGASYPGEHERIVDDELWNSVHVKLAANRKALRRSRVETGSLLMGLIFDAAGNLMTPTYTIRRGNRYRYYVSSVLVRGRKEEAGPHRRVGADNIERIVVETLCQQFNRVDLLIDAGHWGTEIRQLMRDTVQKIVVGHSEVQIVYRVAAAPERAGVSEEDSESPKVCTIQFPAPQARARKEIIIPGKRESAPRRINHALVLAIARAKTWMQGLLSGKYESTAEIAQQLKLNNAHVRRLLRLGYLAPDIVEAIVEGRQPPALTVKQLLKGIPTAWPDQRTAFGFTH